MLETRAVAAHVAALVVVVGGLVLVTGACLPDGRPCSPGDYIDCTCADGSAGARVCDNQGTGYVAACDCTVLVPPYVYEAGADGEGGSEASTDAGLCSGTTNLPITCPCTDDTQCADHKCYAYPSKGPHCTKNCSSNLDCPPPALGCNPMMICKIP
jgi:hypothetical protein